MTGQFQLEVAPLSRFYPQMRQPFAPAEAEHASFSILRQRRGATIPLPTWQYGPIACQEVPAFSYAEIVVAYFPNAVVSRTGAVIVGDRFIIQETLEGSADGNGLTADITPDVLARCPTSDEVILNCNKLGMWNYSLFLFEVAPSIMLSSFLPGLEKLRARVFFQRFMLASDVENRKTIFSLFGVDAARLLIADADLCRHRGVVLFKLNDPHRSQRLSQMVAPVCAVLREAFATNAQSSARRIYISRQRATSRQVSNYDALRDDVLRKHGVVPVELERMPVAQQVELFSKADLVMAEHGAGLANIAFMRPGSTVIEMMPAPIATRAVYRYLAAHCRLNYIYSSFPTPAGWQWDKDKVEAPLETYEHLLSNVQ